VGASGMATPDGFLSAFELLKRELEMQVWVESFHPIATAKVPVIKVTSYSERIPTGNGFFFSLLFLLLLLLLSRSITNFSFSLRYHICI